VGNLRLKWVPNNRPASYSTIDHPIIRFILREQAKKTPQSDIVTKLYSQGFPHSEIKNAFVRILKSRKSKKMMDWRSVTAINQTGRMIRNDIRKSKISYHLGMTILIKSRNTLKTLITNIRYDRRIPQINQEIKTTRKLLSKQYANPFMRQHYSLA